MFQPETWIEELRQTLSWAKLNHEMWRALTSGQTRQKYAYIMNKHSLYFQTAKYAHFATAIIASYRLYENRKDTNNIPKFLINMEKYSKIENNTLNIWNASYDEIKPTWKKIAIIRNQVFAHRSKDTQIHGVIEGAELAPKDFPEFIEKSERLLNSISKKVDNSIHAFNCDSESALMRLLEDLNRMN